MRTKRFLLVTAALATVTSACGKNPATKPEDKADANQGNNWPANPKGSFYDAGIAPTEEPPPPPPPSSTAAEKPKDAGPVIPRMPANPKGSHYDAGRKKSGPADEF